MSGVLLHSPLCFYCLHEDKLTSLFVLTVLSHKMVMVMSVFMKISRNLRKLTYVLVLFKVYITLAKHNIIKKQASISRRDSNPQSKKLADEDSRLRLHGHWHRSI